MKTIITTHTGYFKFAMHQSENGAEMAELPTSLKDAFLVLKMI
jgi:hypothetical protein